MEGREFPADLLELNISDFDVILGMYWLSEHHAAIDCRSKVIRFGPAETQIVYHGTNSKPKIPLVSTMKARKMITKGCTAYLACVSEEKQESPPLFIILFESYQILLFE